MELLKGKPVAQWIDDNTQKTAEGLMGEGIVPTLAILRVGNKGSDVAYESSAVQKAQAWESMWKNLFWTKKRMNPM